MVATIFWAAVGLIAYTYAGYPALLRVLARRRPEPRWPDSDPPSITVLIAAYNESRVIGPKLNETLALDYPAELLQIVVATDGSDDDTPAVVASFANRRVELSHDPARRGKLAAIKRALPRARGDIVVFSDANNHYEPSTLRELVRPFGDPAVGAVTGAKRITSGDGALSDSEGAYWRYEDRIRRDETRLGNCTGVNGEIFAIRRHLIEDPPDWVINDDFYLAMQTIRRGYRVVYAPEATSTERVSASAGDERARRSRIVAGRFQAMTMAPDTLTRREPLVAWQVVSHKFLRPLVPLFMIAAAVANVVAALRPTGTTATATADRPSRIRRAVALEPRAARTWLGLQVAFYGLALLGRAWSPAGPLGRLLYLPTFLVDSNQAALAGLVRFLRRRQSTSWVRVARRGEADEDMPDAPRTGAPLPRARAPRALVVDLSTRFGGSDARVLGLASELPPGTVAIAVLAGSPVGAEARARGIPAHDLGSRKFDPRIALRLARLIRRGRFDVVDTQNPQSRVWGSVAGRLAGVPVVSTLNSWYEAEHEGRLKGRLYGAIERFAPAAEMTIAVAPDIRDNLLARGVIPHRVALIPNAVDGSPASEGWERAAALGELGVPPDATVVMAVGRLVEAKGYDVLVEAAGFLVPHLPGLHVVIVGEGHLRADLEARVARLALDGRVHLPGFREPSQIARDLRAADIFAMPSRTEGTPLALLEAAAAGRPIVASAVGGIPTVLSHDVEAVLTPPGDAPALAAAIRELLDDPTRRDRLGAAAARRMAEAFGRERQVQQTISAYEAALERRRPSPLAGVAS